MKNKLISSLLIFTFVFTASVPALADISYTHDVTMTVTDEVINTTTEKLFGFNQELSGTDVRRVSWLDKNYAAYDNFYNDFENPGYTGTMPTYSQAYFTTGAALASTYIDNGDTYGGNVSYSGYTVTSGSDLYDNQYSDDGTLNHPQKDVLSSSSNQFTYINPDILIPGGIDGYFGFNAFNEIKSDFNGRDIEDLCITEAGEGNHAIKLAPVRGYQYTEDSKNTFGVASFFGKNHLALIDRKTVLSYKLQIASQEADFRQSIAKNCDFDAIYDARDKKQLRVPVLNMVTQSGDDRLPGWYDCLVFKNGVIYLDSSEIGTYTAGEWYDVSYTLDIADGEKYDVTLVITDTAGKEAVNTTFAIELTADNAVSPEHYINRWISSEFEFASRALYGYVFSSWSGKDASENSQVYIDDISFDTITAYDNPTAVINHSTLDFDGYPYPYVRLGGTTANWFKWKLGIGDAKERERYSRQSSSSAVAKTRAVWSIPEWYRLQQTLNPSAELDYVINILDSDEDIIDLVEFLTADSDINGDGIDWSAERRRSGIYAPIKVHMWEIGNEPNINYMDPGIWQNTWDLESYIDRCREIIDILNKYSPDVKIAVAVNTSYINNIYSSTPNPEANWDDDILASDIAADIDYLSFHYYYPDRAYPIDLAIDNLKATIEASGHDHVKIAFTEHGTARSNSRDNAYQGIGLASALAEAQFFNRVFREPVVETANLHSYTLYPARWGVGYVDDDGTFKAGAVYELMKLYYDNAVGDVLYTVMDGFEPEQTTDKTHPNYISAGWDHTNSEWIEGSKYGYSCSAVVGTDGSLNLFVSNSRNHTLNLTLDIPDAFDEYEITEHKVITGKREDDIITSWDGYTEMLTGYDDDGNPVYENVYANDMVYETHTDVSKSDTITIKPYSVNMFKLRNTRLTARTASYASQQRVDISGTVKGATENRFVTLLITDKSTGDIRYIAETELDINDAYRFNFEFGYDLADCDAFINYCSVFKNITGGIDVVSDTDDMFEITAEVTSSGLEVNVDNLFGFLGVDCMMLAQGFTASGRQKGIRTTDPEVLVPGVNVFTANPIYKATSYRLYFWENLANIKPVLKDTRVKK